ncbi:MAG: hypothetical protein JO340_12940 [Acidobacteriaceae bacterium]|nr:hypothetical protein [Acidobacteriaceae bacterium]
MAAAWALTLLAFAGVGAGLLLGHTWRLSHHLAAIGGGVLCGIALFWVIPEIAESFGWIGSASLAIGACCALAALDWLLSHSEHSPRNGIAGPLLAATAIHSFLDGWSVRAFAIQPVADVAVPIGLALHKIPEGLALGWIARRSFLKVGKAVAAAAAVEAFTLAGAVIEPRANRSGVAAFGEGWSAAVLAVIAGSFLFLGVHALAPARKRAGVVGLFVITLLAVGGIALLRR